MYCDYFGLHTPPFNNTPDPRFFYEAPEHEEALASLIFAAQHRKGFVLVTGEVGSGKTLLTRLLTARLGPTFRMAFVTNSRLGPRELLLEVCRGFDIETPADAPANELAHAIREFLLQQYARDRIAIVVLDEAQNLPSDSFEELRLLGNLEADDAKLLQVFILGQPELHNHFRRPELRQLQQRLFRSLQLPALKREMTAGYIAHRLTVAGLAEGRKLFTEDAIDALHRHTEGIPRLINQICDNVLLAAYAQSEQSISAELVETIVKQLSSRVEVPTAFQRQGAFSHAPNATDSAPVMDRASAAAFSDAAAAEFGAVSRIRQEATSLVRELRESLLAANHRMNEPSTIPQPNSPEILSTVERIAAAVIERLAGELQQRVATDLENRMAIYRAETQQLTEVAAGVRSSFEAAAVATRKSVERAKLDAEKSLQERLTSAISTIDSRLAEVVQQGDGADSGVRSIAAENQRELIAQADQQFATIRDEVQQLAQEAGGVRNELAAMVHAAKNSIEQTRLDTERIVQSHARTAIEQVDARLADAVRQGDTVRDQSKAVAADLADRLRIAREKLQAAISEAHEASESVRNQSRGGLNEVRTMLSQINDRATVIRADLVRLADAVQQSAREAVEGLHQSAVAIFNQLDDVRGGIKSEAAQHHDRLQHARREADKVIARLQQSASESLSRAQETATRLTEKADAILVDTRSMADAAVDRAEAILRKSESLVGSITEEIRSIRENATREVEQTREQLHAARLLIIESRDESARAMKELRELQEKAHARTDELIRRGEEVSAHTKALLHVPREQIEEAGRRAAGLAQLSKKTSEIVHRLADTGTRVDEQIAASTRKVEEKIAAVDKQAEQASKQVEQAAGEADRRIEILRQQTARVGQLVTIVRQLYGSLDARARIQQIRSRLEQADELCRGVVPREMENLRSVIAEQLGDPAHTPDDSSVATNLSQRLSRQQNRLTPKPTTPAPKQNASPRQARPRSPKPSSTGSGSLTLGDVVARNKKLNEWLKQTLGDAAGGEPVATTPEAQRFSEAPLPKAPETTAQPT